MALNDAELLISAHDCSLVSAGVYHDFHNAWLTMLRQALNSGILPQGYYALVEQHSGRFFPIC